MKGNDVNVHLLFVWSVSFFMQLLPYTPWRGHLVVSWWSSSSFSYLFVLVTLSQWKEVPAAQVSCGPAFTHRELKPTWLSTSSNHGGGGHQATMGGSSSNYGGAISQLWGGHQPSMGGSSTNYGGASAKYGGSSTNYGGGHQPTMGGAIRGGHIFPPVCTGSQNPQNYFSNTYVLPSVNRTAGPKNLS